ncbi:MAG: DNA topoisomerase I, partial [Chloroflexi bacterium]
DDLDAEVRIGQFGPFVAKEVNGERLTAGLPPDLPPADLTDELVEQLLSQKQDGPQTLGTDPETEQPIFLKSGPYGPYVQLGEDGNGKKKPKRASLLKGMDPSQVTLDVALQLLSLPRTLGDHPETGKPVQASVGRFGPYIVHDGKYVNLKGDSVLEIDLDRALELLAGAAERKGRSGGRTTRSSAKTVLKTLGEHPDGGAIQVLDGRYGPYVNYNKVNVTLPKEVKPEDVTLEQALAWVTAKAGTGASTKRKRARNAKKKTASTTHKKTATARS